MTYPISWHFLAQAVDSLNWNVQNEIEIHSILELWLFDSEYFLWESDIKVSVCSSLSMHASSETYI
jgi:hypothetical protein